MRILLVIFIFLNYLTGNCQSIKTLSSICKEVSAQWKIDSNSCKGYRLKVAESFKNVKIDSITKNFLFSTLGKPNNISKYYRCCSDGNYVEYIYYIYKDDCPRIYAAGAGIGFVFDETESYFIKIEDHDYCR